MDKKRINKTDIFKIVAAILGIVILVGVAMRESNRNKVEAPDVEPEVTTTITTPVTTLVSTSISTTTENTTIVTTTEITTEETTTTTEIVTDAPVIEVAPETEAPKAEEVVETEAPVKVQPVETEKQEEYLVYKESTHYIHKNTCRWNKGDAYRVDDVTGLEARLCTECNPICEGYTEYIPPEPVKPDKESMTYVKHFTRGTYYCYGYECYGGSGRYLYDCSYGAGNGIKGSIASSYLYSNYGYNYNGQRTTVYLEVNGYPELSGFYYVDDSDAGNWNVIDFFYIYGSNCPFANQGVVEVDCWI